MTYLLLMKESRVLVSMCHCIFDTEIIEGRCTLCNISSTGVVDTATLERTDVQFERRRRRKVRSFH